MRRPGRRRPPLFGFVTALPSADLVTIADELRFTIETGFVSQPVAVVAAALPNGGPAATTLPVAVTDRYLQESGAAVGDRLRLSPVGSGSATSRSWRPSRRSRPSTCARWTPWSPICPTVQLTAWSPGEPIGSVDEYWLGLGIEGAGAEPLLRAPPLEVSGYASLDQRIDRRTTDPPAIGTLGAMSIGFVAAAVFATIGFAVSASISARERANEFATLRALGLSRRQLGRWLASEQVLVGVTGLVLGLAIGLAMSAFLLPQISLTQRGEAIFPPLEVTYPWISIGRWSRGWRSSSAQ